MMFYPARRARLGRKQGEIMGMKSRGFICILLALAFIPACSNNESSAIGTEALFVLTQGNAKVAAFSINQGNGVLSTNGDSVATGAGPSAILLTPSGTTLFVTNTNPEAPPLPPDPGSISIYKVNSDGTLSTSGEVIEGSTCSFPPCPAELTPVAMAVDPSGTFLFVANRDSSNIAVFSITGNTLTELSGQAFPITSSGNGPSALVVSSDSKYLYVANQYDATVWQFAIDPSGSLSLVPGGIFATGTTPSAMALTPSGLFLYVANTGSSNVTGFAVCAQLSANCPVADGSLLELTDSPFPVGLSPGSIAMVPNGDFLYVANRGSNSVSEFAASSLTGTLTPLTPASVSVGINPASISIPSGGQFLFSANNGAATISLFQITPSAGVVPGFLVVNGQPVATGPQPSGLATN